MLDEKVIKIINENFPKMTDKGRLAFAIAFGAHTGKGQKDYAGLEYIGHPLTVYSNCDTEEERIAAEEAAKNAPKPVTTEDLLTEIRDLLRNK